MKKKKNRAKTRAVNCRVCGSVILDPKPLQKYHKGECAAKALAEQLEQLRASRKTGYLEKEKTCPCCGTSFLPPFPRSVYCSSRCQGEGLKAAVERQRQRREDAKREKVSQGASTEDRSKRID